MPVAGGRLLIRPCSAGLNEEILSAGSLLLCRFCRWRLNGLAGFGRLQMSGNISQLFMQAIAHVDWVGSLAVVLLMVAITMVGYRINHPIL